MMIHQFCIDHGHTWEVAQHFIVPGFPGELHLKLVCAQCRKAIAGSFSVEQLGEDIMENFTNITEWEV